MASNIEFVEFICYQLQELGHIRFRKMFGDYMVYVNEKLLLMLQRSKRNNCGGCPLFPCSHFVNDSSISKEENEKNLKKMIDNLSEFNQ